MRKVWTVGHSTRSLQELLRLLQEVEIRILWDIRSYPSSRRHPHFNRGNLEETLPKEGIRYRHLPQLGGLRRPGPAPSPNRGWKSPGFQAYADHMASREFRSGIEAILESARRRPSALMCAEITPYRCHRRLVSDFLVLVAGVEVMHILGASRWEPHRVTPFARRQGECVIYPPLQGNQGSLPLDGV